MVITNSEQLEQALAWLGKQEMVAYDTETTGLNPRKDRIIGIGFSNDSTGFYMPLFTYSEDSLKPTPIGTSDNISRVLSSLASRALLMFNASFDARFTKYNFGIDLVPALHADVLLLKHSVDEEFPFGLKEISKQIWGHEVTKEKEEMQASIKNNGGTAKQYFKADTDILGKYCIQDCVLTYKLFLHYSRELKQQGLEDFYYKDEVLPLYKEVTIPMEEVGIHLDVPLLQSSLIEIQEDLAKLEHSIQEAIIPYLGIFTTWFLNKDYPVQTWNTKKPSMWTKKYATQAEAWRAENTGYMFNLLSKHHLKKLFFDTFKETPLSRTEKGNPQVDEEFLELMGKRYAWCKDLIVYNKLIKLKGTYIERFLDEHEDGIFYPSFQQHRTVSGRYSGDLQQLPRPTIDDGGLVAKYTNRIRAFFISSPGSVLMSADYAQLEPRVFAHVSGDPALAEIFNSGKDFYSEIAVMVEGVKEVSKEQRQNAKTYALGIPYGMTGFKLKFEINCEQEEADALVRKYLDAFPKLEEWMNVSKNKAISEGRITSQGGRVRHLSVAKDMYNKYGPAICDDLQLWKTFNTHPAVYAQAKVDRRVFKNALNNAINFQIQSYAASIMSRTSIAVNRTLIAYNLKAKIVGQVHDELILHVPASEVEVVSSIVTTCMQTIVTLSVPLKTTPQIGTNYSLCK